MAAGGNAVPVPAPRQILRQAAAQHHTVAGQQQLQQLLLQLQGCVGVAQSPGGIQFRGQPVIVGRDFQIDPGRLWDRIHPAGQRFPAQQAGKLLSGRAARGKKGGTVLGKDAQRPGSVKPLAAGIAAAGKHPVGAAGNQGFHLQRFVNRGIQRYGVDHRSNLRVRLSGDVRGFPRPVYCKSRRLSTSERFGAEKRSQQPPESGKSFFVRLSCFGGTGIFLSLKE